MLKKMMLLASMALAALAFAIPASASAANWVHNGEEGPETVNSGTEVFSGFAIFDVVGAPIPTSYGCEVHAHVTITGAETATTGFEITTKTCVGTGVLANCVLKADSSTAPWAVDLATTDFTITNIEIVNEFASPCPVAKAELDFAAVTATPDDPSAIGSITLSGTGKNTVTGGPVLATGTLTAANPGTYGIE